MTRPDDTLRRLAEIAQALSMTTEALVAMSVQGSAAIEADARELAANFLATADPDARERLLRLSRTLASQALQMGEGQLDAQTASALTPLLEPAPSKAVPSQVEHVVEPRGCNA